MVRLCYVNSCKFCVCCTGQDVAPAFLMEYSLSLIYIYVNQFTTEQTKMQS